MTVYKLCMVYEVTVYEFCMVYVVKWCISCIRVMDVQGVRGVWLLGPRCFVYAMCIVVHSVCVSRCMKCPRCMVYEVGV